MLLVVIVAALFAIMFIGYITCVVRRKLRAPLVDAEDNESPHEDHMDGILRLELEEQEKRERNAAGGQGRFVRLQDESFRSSFRHEGAPPDALQVSRDTSISHLKRDFSDF